MTFFPKPGGLIVGGWTGEELIVWEQIEQVGYRFHSGTETWRRMPPEPSLSRGDLRVGAVSSGRFFLWNDEHGAAYDWAADTWSPIAPMGGDPMRSRWGTPWWIAVGTPTHLIFIDHPLARVPGRKPPGWSATLTGKLYDVARDVWQPLPTRGAPAAAIHPVAVWADKELIVWGGGTETGASNSGARFDPLTATWKPMTTVGAPSPRGGAAGVWTGKRLFVWGGGNEHYTVRDGGLYDPVRDEWVAVTVKGAPPPESDRGAVWTGKEVIVTGRDSRIYDPSTNRWRPTAQKFVTRKELMQWDGRRLLAFGLSPGYIYEPPQP